MSRPVDRHQHQRRPRPVRLIAVFAEFERDLIEERRTEGMRRYYEQLATEGRRPGPEPKLDPAEVKALRKQGLLIREIMAKVCA